MKSDPGDTTSVASKNMTNPLPSPSQRCDADILLLCQHEEVGTGNFSRQEDASDLSEEGCIEGLQPLEISYSHPPAL